MIIPIPVDTDAPIYYWPKGTVGLIVANVIAFFITGGGFNDTAIAWMLHYGDGLHPLQWVTCNFVHFGLIHLLGNMMFLWGFGIVVEGKLGWWRYLAVYFLIGVAHSFIEQVVMLDSEDGPTGAGGASGAIYGLLAIAMVWAPKNEITFKVVVFIVFIWRVLTLDVPILSFSLFYIGMQLFIALVSGFDMSSSVIHLLGAVCGFIVGAVMLKLNWVDCENWDLFAVLRGTYGNRANDESTRFRKKSARRAPRHSPDATPALPAAATPDDEFHAAAKHIDRQTRLLRKVESLIKTGRPNRALSEYQRLKRSSKGVWLEGPLLKELADGLYADGRYAEAAPLLEEYVARFPDEADRLRLKLAAVLIEVRKRPRLALRILAELPADPLPGKLEENRRKMEAVARQMIEEGLLELEEGTER